MSNYEKPTITVQIINFEDICAASTNLGGTNPGEQELDGDLWL